MNNETRTNIPVKLTLLKALVAGWLAAMFMIYTVLPSTVFACVVAAVFLFCAYKANKRGFALTAVVTALTFLVLGASVTALAYVLSLISAALVGGIMLCGKKSAVLYLVFGSAAYAVAAILKSPTEALPVLTSVPLAIALAVCIKTRARRVSAVCVISAVFAIILIAPYAVSFYLQHGSESLEQFKLLLDEVRVLLTDSVVKAYEEIPEDAKKQVADIFTPDVIASSIDAVFPLIPAIFIIVCNTFAFSLHTLSIWIRASLGDSLKEEEKIFSMSKTSAWLYIISFIAMLFSLSDSDFAQIIMLSMQGLNMILTPSFLWLGLSSVSVSFRTADGKKSIFHTVIAILAFLYCGTFLIYPLVIFGVVKTLKSKTINP